MAARPARGCGVNVAIREAVKCHCKAASGDHAHQNADQLLRANCKTMPHTEVVRIEKLSETFGYAVSKRIDQLGKSFIGAEFRSLRACHELVNELQSPSHHGGQQREWQRKQRVAEAD